MTNEITETIKNTTKLNWIEQNQTGHQNNQTQKSKSIEGNEKYTISTCLTFKRKMNK